MTGITKINLRAALQYFILVALVFLLGVWLRAKANEEGSPKLQEAEAYCLGLPFEGLSVEDYPDVKLGSTKAWNKYLKGLTPYDIQFEGEGYINKNGINVKCVLLSNGQLVGRYHNANGTDLDLNGYIIPSTGELKIHLGHASNKTLSNWYLSPVESYPETGTFVYEGTWGKKKLPSKLIFKRIYN